MHHGCIPNEEKMQKSIGFCPVRCGAVPCPAGGDSVFARARILNNKPTAVSSVRDAPLVAGFAAVSYSTVRILVSRQDFVHASFLGSERFRYGSISILCSITTVHDKRRRAPSLLLQTILLRCRYHHRHRHRCCHRHRYCP